MPVVYSNKKIQNYLYLIVIFHYIVNMFDNLDYIAFDFEIANLYKNSACSIDLVRFIDGKETDSCYSLIHPAKMYFIPEWIELVKQCGLEIE